MALFFKKTPESNLWQYAIMKALLWGVVSAVIITLILAFIALGIHNDYPNIWFFVILAPIVTGFGVFLYVMIMDGLIPNQHQKKQAQKAKEEIKHILHEIIDDPDSNLSSKNDQIYRKNKNNSNKKK